MEKQYGCTLKLDDSEFGIWRQRAEAAREVLEVDLRQRGLVPLRAPELLSTQAVPHQDVSGPFRLLCAYVLFNVIGYSDTELDEDGQPAAIYGPPCFMVRVDTLVAE